jgi:tetratricopeptide (TPR) repeat protein
MHLAEKHAEALSLFEQAQERGSHPLPEVAESHAISLLTENRYREVIPLLDDAIIQWPGFPWLKMRRGQALASLGRHEDAARDFREALAPHPEDGYLISLLTDSLLELERYQEAANCADMPSFANRTELHMLLLRWRAYVGVGRKESAAQALHQATMHEDALKEVYEHLYVIPDPGKAAEAIKKLEQPGVPFFREAYLAIDGIKRD